MSGVESHEVNATFNQRASPPAFAAVVAAPTGALRIVYGTWHSGTLGDLWAEVETAEGAGTYQVVQYLATSGLTIPFSFAVPRGRRYRFMESGTGNGIDHYSTLELE